MNILGQNLQVVITVLLAVFGALARLLRQKETTMQLSNMISGCFVAAFAGVLAHFIAAYFSFDDNLAYILAGICGWGGPHILDIIFLKVGERIGIDIHKPSKESGKPADAEDKPIDVAGALIDVTTTPIDTDEITQPNDDSGKQETGDPAEKTETI